MIFKREAIANSVAEKNEIVDITKNNVFAFWESKDEIPAYLELCKKTWYRNIPNCEIHIINYQNIQSYIGNTYDLDKLKKISLAMQSDIISAAILEKFGGLFLDIDRIVTNDIFEIFNSISKDKLIAFGVPESKSIHLAVLYSYKPENPIMKTWRVEAQRKLENIPDNYRWDYFGNAIVNPLLKNNLYEDKYHIIERSISGNVLESTVIMGADHNTVVNDYRNFYFNEYLSLRPEVLSLVKCGVISLHNSWTPHKYKNIKNIEDFLCCQIPIVSILDFAMKNSKKLNYNSLPILEGAIINRLCAKDICYRSKYFREMLVLDFKINNVEFAFDISESNELITTFLVLRGNSDIEKIQGMFSKKYNDRKFQGNRVKIVATFDRQEVIQNILNIYKLISEIKFLEKIHENRFNKNLVEDNIFIDLKYITIENNILFIDGICIPIGINVNSYDDISYTLIIKGEKTYKRPLAKDNRPELSKSYSTSYNISYDKCWFTTYNHKGIDISDFKKGEYILEIEINVKNYIKNQSIRSGKSILIKRNTFDFTSNSTSNKIIIY